MKKSPSLERKKIRVMDARSVDDSGSPERPARPEASSNPKPMARPPEIVRSPQNEKIRIQFHHPSASEVCIAGSFNDWNPQATPLSSQGDGTWKTELSLNPGTYEYRFVVDGVWADDPNCGRSIPNPFGSVNSILQVGEA